MSAILARICRRSLRYLPALAILACIGGTGCESTDATAMLDAIGSGNAGELTVGEISTGLKEALKVGTETASTTASTEDGYLKNPRLHIPPPPQVRKVTDTLRKVGMGAMVDDFETSMNRGAEQAAREAMPVFRDAILAMTIDDARAILSGPDDAATQYFRRTTSDTLTARYRPIVRDNLDRVGAAREYNLLLDRYKALGLGAPENADLDAYVTDQALNGLFLLVADQEAKIRKDPAARTSAILRRVFGGN